MCISPRRRAQQEQDMRRKMIASLAVLTSGAWASAQTPPTATPQAMMGGGAYGGGFAGQVMPAGGGGVQTIPPVYAGQPGPEMMGGPPMGDPAGGLMQGGGPTYPPPGFQGMDQYGAGAGGGGNASVPHWWVNTELFLWYIQSQPVRQPYVTTSSPGDFGVVGASTTQTLFSRDNMGYGSFAGFRIMGGWYKDADRRCGFEFGGFLSEQESNIFSVSSDANGVPTIARPFNIAGGGGPGVFIVANLGLAAGGVTVNSQSRFYGAEGSFINNIYRSCPDAACFWNTDALIGVRYFELKESLNFASSSTILGGGAAFVGQPVTIGGRIDINDNFGAVNEFYGGQLGLRSNINYGRCVIGLSGKVAIGLMHQEVNVEGSTRLVDPALGINAAASGGVFANSQNIGRYTNDEFSILPEVGLNIGYQWCSWFSTSIGYNGLYVTDVVRPGNTVPNAVNPSLLPSSNNFGNGVVAPVANNSLTQSDVWIQGVTFGFNVKW